jgi:hypothetical protein
MAVKFPNGTVFDISATFGASKAMTAITNATQAVGTLEASHGVVVNDVVLITSGWSKLNGRVAVASVVDTNNVTFKAINTADTVRYAPGSGVGSVKEIATWTQLSQVLDFTSSGGEQQFATYSFLEDDTERQHPTRKSARAFTVNLADDPSLAWGATLAAADEDTAVRVLRATLPGGSVIYYPCIVSFDETPSLTKDQPMALTATFSHMARATRYDPS